ncbi:virulence factor Mce family protein [Mycobacterium barrassiae]|uniref:virulence factor Mce family protein n=1 Tax=Mycobacterium barrassiae TaxID=319709 RepID=UPI0023DFDEB8|nr:virulence factor Mce family protein [Mycobacterium barrassiae]
MDRHRHDSRQPTGSGEDVKELKAAAWRLGIFLAVCLLGALVLFTVFAQFRFEQGKSYFAQFVNVSGLRNGDIVRIAGVEVGKVQNIVVNRDATVRVEFSADESVVLTEGSRVEIRFDDLIGNRFLALLEGAGGLQTLEPGDTIPTDHTRPALDLDAVIGGFQPLFRALDPDQVNELTGQLIEAFQGQGTTIGSFLTQAAAVTNTLADRDLLIGQTIDNLNIVLGSLGGQSERFDKAVTALSELVGGLAERRTDLSNAVAHIDAGAGSFADLFADAREPFQRVVQELDRAAGIAVADHEYLERFIEQLPDKYRALNRQAMYGDYFSFYLCDAVLKLNGKGGQPVYVKAAGQSTGRCAPK